jgi:hypothetical protein
MNAARKGAVRLECREARRLDLTSKTNERLMDRFLATDAEALGAVVGKRFLVMIVIELNHLGTW